MGDPIQTARGDENKWPVLAGGRVNRRLEKPAGFDGFSMIPPSSCDEGGQNEAAKFLWC